MQKSESGETSVPHFGQTFAAGAGWFRRVPQFMQKLSPSAHSVPHFGQRFAGAG